MKHYKEQTERLAIVDLPAPQVVVIPMAQHVGTRAEVKVSVGDHVNVGQVIGSADAFVTALVHASVSGTVTHIEPRPHSQGLPVLSVVVQNDGKNTIDPSCAPYQDVDALSPEAIVELVKKAGIVGMSGSGFPTHVKLHPPKDKRVDTLILNAAECEPFLTADHRLLLESAEDVLLGLRAATKALGVTQVFIGLEDNKKDAVSYLKKAGAEQFAKIVLLRTEYPTGAEKVLVKKVTGRVVPRLGLPLDVGCVVMNVGTAAQIARTIRTGMPIIDRVVTIAGEVLNPGNYRVKLGTRVSDLVQFEGGSFEGMPGQHKMLMGGPMMGAAQITDDVPIIKGSSGVVVMSAVPVAERNCIRCGKCVDGCPLGLLPYDEYNEVNDNCMECGRCAFYCPSKRHLVQRIKMQKLERQTSRKA